MLKRKWARASIVLMGSGLAMLLIVLLFGEVVLFVSETSIGWMASCGVTLMLLGGFCHLSPRTAPTAAGLAPGPGGPIGTMNIVPAAGGHTHTMTVRAALPRKSRKPVRLSLWTESLPGGPCFCWRRGGCAV